ncbi:MAG: JAB domain-containing protein [Anaerolineales bacterium]|nr:MAG: JAB domain-containing protein [Anaerolineales bacterium]
MEGISSTYRIKDLQQEERPRERLAKLGAGVLSTAELLAVLLRVGVEGENAIQVGQRLLRDFNGLAGLQRATYAEICAQHGIGEAKAAQIKAAIDLGRRLATQTAGDKAIVSSPEDAADLVQFEMSALEQEQLRVILLNTRNHVLAVKTIYQGSLNSSLVRVGELFRPAIRENAAALIVIHNHPSGDPSPSPDDVTITKAIISAGKLLDIQVLDHLIIGQGRFISLNRRGLGFSED